VYKMSLDGKIHIVAVCKYDTFVTECISYISTLVTDQVYYKEIWSVQSTWSIAILT
jgi:hypothetical protein